MCVCVSVDQPAVSQRGGGRSSGTKESSEQEVGFSGVGFAFVQTDRAALT